MSIRFCDKESLGDAGGVYAIVNLIDGRQYIGSTKNLQRRYMGHWTSLIEKRHSNLGLQSAMLEEGIKNLEFAVVEELQDTSMKNLRVHEALARCEVSREMLYNGEGEITGDKKCLTNFHDELDFRENFHIPSVDEIKKLMFGDDE